MKVEAMRSHLWTKPYEDRRAFIGGSDALIIMGDDEGALVRLSREKRCEVEPGNVSDEPRPSAGRVHAAHAKFVAALANTPPRTIPLDVGAIHLEDRAHHLSKVFNALSIYVTVILDDTGQNISGRADFGDVGAALSDLASDVTCTIQLAADAMAAGRVA
jgi:hypothetical protein